MILLLPAFAVSGVAGFVALFVDLRLVLHHTSHMGAEARSDPVSPAPRARLVLRGLVVWRQRVPRVGVEDHLPPPGQCLETRQRCKVELIIGAGDLEDLGKASELELRAIRRLV